MIIFILTWFDIKNSRDGTGKKVMALFVEGLCLLRRWAGSCYMVGGKEPRRKGRIFRAIHHTMINIKYVLTAIG